MFINNFMLINQELINLFQLFLLEDMQLLYLVGELMKKGRIIGDVRILGEKIGEWEVILI